MNIDWEWLRTYLKISALKIWKRMDDFCSEELGTKYWEMWKIIKRGRISQKVKSRLDDYFGNDIDYLNLYK